MFRLPVAGVLVVAWVLCASLPVFADEPQGGEPANDRSAPAGSSDLQPQAVRLPTVWVIGAAPADASPQSTEISDASLYRPGAHHVGQSLLEIPGISAVERGAGQTEPVIRGLGWERITTTSSGVPMFGACPARMDPPVSYLRNVAVTDAIVVRALGSVTHGPGGTGGRVIVKNDYQRPADAPDGFSGMPPGWACWTCVPPSKAHA